MLIGHQKQRNFLEKTAKSDKLAHAYLFCGQEKLGKKTIAVEFAKWLFKDDIIKKQHPDFIFIEPPAKNLVKGKPVVDELRSSSPFANARVKKEIQISQIRECIWRLSLKPSVAPFKIAIIDEAHCLNQEAQNSLLKTLEEPRGKTLIFLITEYPERLFPTIISRCQTLKFYPVKREEIEKYLKNENISKNQIEEMLDISSGRPGRALDFMSDPQKLKTQKTVISDLIKVSNSDLAFRFQYAKNLTGEFQNLKDTLDIWLRHFRGVLISSVNGVSQAGYSLSTRALAKGGDERSSLTTRALAKGGDERSSSTKLRSIIKLIQETNFLISTTNVNPRLALEILMMEL